MENQTHYETLEIDENASPEIIASAYQRLLKDAKDKLQDSPLYYTKEKKLYNAYEVLSNPTLRHAYNNKLIRERASSINNTYTPSDTFNVTEFLGGLIFSRAFLGSVVLVIILLVLIPSGEERIVKEVFSKQFDYEYDIRNQQMELNRQRELRNSSTQEYTELLALREQERRETAETRRLEMQARRLDLEEQREMKRIDREERLLLMQEEKAARQAEYEKQQQKEREKREQKSRRQQEAYAAKRRARELIESQKQTTRPQQHFITTKSGYN